MEPRVKIMGVLMFACVLIISLESTVNTVIIFNLIHFFEIIFYKQTKIQIHAIIIRVQMVLLAVMLAVDLHVLVRLISMAKDVNTVCSYLF